MDKSCRKINSKYIHRATFKWFKPKHIHVLKWPSQSPGLYQTWNLWLDLKFALQRCTLSNLTDRKLFCKESRVQFSVSTYAKLAETHHKGLPAVTAAKVALQNFNKCGLNRNACHTAQILICKKKYKLCIMFLHQKYAGLGIGLLPGIPLNYFKGYYYFFSSKYIEG